MVRRRLPAPAPTSPEAHLGAAGNTASAGPGWTPADEARYQHSLQQLHALVGLRHQPWAPSNGSSQQPRSSRGRRRIRCPHVLAGGTTGSMPPPSPRRSRSCEGFYF